MLSRRCIPCLAQRLAPSLTSTGRVATSTVRLLSTKGGGAESSASSSSTHRSAEDSTPSSSSCTPPRKIPMGPLPTDPLAPPPQPAEQSTPYEPRTTSAILDDSYLRASSKRWKTDPHWEDNKLRPYAYMAASFSRRCIVSRCMFPKAFMLKLKPARVDDKGTLVLFPEDVQHPKYVPAKTGKGIYVALHRNAVNTLVNESEGYHAHQLKEYQPGMIVPSNLPDMVDDMLGKRVVQELEVARRVIRSMPREHADFPFFRPLSAEQEAALREHDQLPQFDDGAKIIAVLDVNLRNPIVPTLLQDPAANGTSADGEKQLDPEVPVLPLKLASHAPQAAALVRSIIAMERRRATTDAIAAAEAQVDAAVKARAVAEGVSVYEAGTEAIADDHGQLPQPEIDAATNSLEAHRRDEDAGLVAVTVPPAQVGHWRATGVPLVVALLRVGLWNGIGWEQSPAEN